VNTTEKEKPLLVVITGRTDKNLIYRIRAKPPIFEHDIFIRREENQRQDAPIKKYETKRSPLLDSYFFISAKTIPQHLSAVKVSTTDKCCSFLLM